MKPLKIGIVLVVIAAIAFFVIKSQGSGPEPPPIGGGEGISLQENPFVKFIIQEIDSIGKMPNHRSCKDFYKVVAYHIDDYYAQNRLGNNQSENDQLKTDLSKNLFTAYTKKFILQAFYVFDRSKWETEDLDFIRSEYQTLRNSKLLEKGSPVDLKFTEIQNIFRKYDEISAFISSCKAFSYSNTRLRDRFPVPDVNSKISRSVSYLSNRMENEKVNNCVRLHDQLKEIPESLFRKHSNYLDNKIRHWSGMYSSYSSYNGYVDNLYSKLKDEIDELDRGKYNVSTGDRKRLLLRKLAEDDAEAKKYLQK